MIGHRRKDRTMQHARQMSNHQNYMLTKEMVNRFDSLFTGTPADKVSEILVSSRQAHPCTNRKWRGHT
jgi:hypothetical protein